MSAWSEKENRMINLTCKQGSEKRGIGLCFSSAVPKIQWDSNPTAPTAISLFKSLSQNEEPQSISKQQKLRPAYTTMQTDLSICFKMR